MISVWDMLYLKCLWVIKLSSRQLDVLRLSNSVEIECRALYWALAKLHDSHDSRPPKRERLMEML